LLDGRSVSALTYVASPDNPNYLGPASLLTVADRVRSAVGPSGTNRDYALRLAEAIRDMGQSDPHVFELVGLLL
jgi:cation transport regulator ChaC